MYFFIILSLALSVGQNNHDVTLALCNCDIISYYFLKTK